MQRQDISRLQVKSFQEQKERAMRLFGVRGVIPFMLLAATLLVGNTLRAEGDPHKAKHVIVIMQENHSFDNYFG
ncbi:MAG: alkaline phosphatase family protein, partial [Candidatus Angelobacter sp.]